MSGSKRVSLADLGTAAATKVSEPPPASMPAPASEAQAPTKKPPKTTRAKTRRKAEPAGEWQRFDSYERKEARLRPDQYGALGTAARELQRNRTTKGERITENTLIRVAIDLLLARESELTGESEADLRRSVGL